MKKNLALSFLSKFGIYLIAFFINFATRWVTRNFGEVSFDQLLYHLQFGLGNVANTDSVLVADFYKRAIYIPIALALIFAVIHQLFPYIKKFFVFTFKKIYTAISEKSLPSFFYQPLQFYILIFACCFSIYKFSILTYLTNEFGPAGEDYYVSHYIAPNDVSFHNTDNKNLILIYLESIENTYANEKLFKENLIRRIEPSYLGGTQFKHTRQLPGTGWTIAGIVATQCGIPLKPAIGGLSGQPQNSVFEEAQTFLPNITCLPDILKSYGYKNIYMQGASLEFAGKRKFFTSHSYDETYGREEFIKMDNKIPLSNWGVYDDDLLAFAKKKIDELEANPDQPYNITLLTLDTHQPQGHLSHTCAERGVDEFKGIVRCTAEMVSELVEYVREKGYLENTTIVLMGDHLAMTNPKIDKLQEADERFIFNNYISNDGALTNNRSEIVHFDHFPTILDSLGLKVPEGKLGLGISGFASNKYTAEQMSERFDMLKNNILRYSETYQAFWNKPKS